MLTAITAAMKRGDINEKSHAQLVSFMNMVRDMTKTGAARAIVVNPGKLWEALINKYSNVHTLRTKMNRVNSILKYDTDLGTVVTRVFWKKRHERAKKASEDKYDNNVLEEKDAAKMVDFDELLKVVNALAGNANDECKTSMEHLWLLVAAKVPAKRSDWGALKYVKRKEMTYSKEQNFIIVPEEGPATLVLNKYKYSKDKGRFEEDLPGDVTAALRESLREWPREYMFENTKSNPYSNDTFSAWSAKTLRKHLGGRPCIQGLRYSYAQPMADGTHTTAERKALAKSMLHSTTAQSTAYQHVMKNE